jgi:hypothetical protein
MKPRQGISKEEEEEQFWMGDPYMGAWYSDYAQTLPSGREVEHYLGDGDEYDDSIAKIPPLAFVELPDADNPDQLWRYAYQPTERMKEITIKGKAWKYPEKELERVQIDAIQSRYGFTWEDLSTPENRQYWVAKSRLQIVDLQNRAVIAERIGYAWGYGGWRSEGGGRQRNCPPRGQDERWIRSVLLKLPFEESR